LADVADPLRRRCSLKRPAGEASRREAYISVVLADPGGFAIDWDWQRRLTVWTIREDRFGDKITEHQLETRPGSEVRPPARRGTGGGTGKQGQHSRH
jgi:hypothetical protein